MDLGFRLSAPWEIGEPRLLLASRLGLDVEKDPLLSTAFDRDTGDIYSVSRWLHTGMKEVSFREE